jgi:superfamily II DNA helicase RecQ
MALKFFIVPAFDPAAAEAKINAFPGRHRVVTIERRWVEQGGGSFWAICVDHFPAGGSDNRRTAALGRNRVDYRQVLSPEEFVVFSRLRELRKQIAQSEAVPVYAIFTNEQLAQAVQHRCRSADALKAIDGFGDARIEKYGEQLLAILTSLAEHTEGPNAPGRPPV